MHKILTLFVILGTATLFASSSLPSISLRASIGTLELKDKTACEGSGSIFRFRGGQDASNQIDSSGSSAPTTIPTTATVLVSTSIGSLFLDKKKKLVVSRNCTILELKETIRDKFPGGPPVQLQKLFFGTRVLNDSELVANITTATQVPLLLDMLTGTSAYNRTMSVIEALEAYTASLTQQAYIGDKLRSIYAIEAGIDILASDGTMESLIYKEMFRSINESLYATYSSDIQAALLAESEPEIDTADTAKWRTGKKPRGPLAVAIAKEFDINTRTLKTFFYYSVLLVVRNFFENSFMFCSHLILFCLLQIFAKFGTSSKDSSSYLFALIPILWVSKIRQLRLIYKVYM